MLLSKSIFYIIFLVIYNLLNESKKFKMDLKVLEAIKKSEETKHNPFIWNVIIYEYSTLSMNVLTKFYHTSLFDFLIIKIKY